ncbi:hypothetical protein BD410DRAFT_826633 [Rickenella mellea]|uniref:Uncharacterized protein n=1 Tax=Rickenella mellea TaxID=50990 RepID=A0A4Y7QDF1_9AGAM|nr:hypothetical protein BD410DRAFT_826633 [Rickenella mellea]
MPMVKLFQHTVKLSKIQTSENVLVTSQIFHIEYSTHPANTSTSGGKRANLHGAGYANNQPRPDHRAALEEAHRPMPASIAIQGSDTQKGAHRMGAPDTPSPRKIAAQQQVAMACQNATVAGSDPNTTRHTQRRNGNGSTGERWAARESVSSPSSTTSNHRALATPGCSQTYIVCRGRGAWGRGRPSVELVSPDLVAIAES